MSTLAKDFNVGAVQGGHYQRMDVTLTWDSDIPMEFRLHMWQPTAKRFAFGEDGWATGKSEGITVIWSISRELLITVTSPIKDPTDIGLGDVTAVRVRFPGGSSDPSVDPGYVDWTYLRLSSDDGQIRLGFSTEPLAAFVRTTLAMCPTESEALDVDGLITQIFNAEEADQ
jgi:hypothetical protein